MSFWNSERIHASGVDLVEPFKDERVANCSYELTLGSEAYVTGGEFGKKIDLEERGAGAQLVIPPGQFGLLLSEEIVHIPHDAIGLISVKSAFKLHGLINVSGFHVDPGFDGRLIFSVYNAGGNDLVVSRGQPLFLLWVCSLEGPTVDVYNGARDKQEVIPDSDIMAIGHEHFSPAAVNDRLRVVEHRLDLTWHLARSVFIALIVAAILAIISVVGDRLLDAVENSQTPTPTSSPSQSASLE